MNPLSLNKERLDISAETDFSGKNSDKNFFKWLGYDDYLYKKLLLSGKYCNAVASDPVGFVCL